MNILIVYSHPSKKSYTFQVLEKLKSEIAKQNWNLEISDLYASNFQSDMSEEEYDREGFAKLDLPISEDVLAEQEKNRKSRLHYFSVSGLVERLSGKIKRLVRPGLFSWICLRTNG